MRLYIAWALANPVGWEPYDIVRSVDVRKLPDKGVPTGGEVIDDTRGWVAGVDVQGVQMVGFDHYHPRINPTNPLLVDIVCWNDDPVDWPSPWAIIWSFANPRTDPRVGNQMNTEQYCAVYGNAAYLPNDSTTGGPVAHHSWADFVVPATSNLNRHGIWVPSDCENCPHASNDHVGGTGSACTFADCTGYASLWQRHMDMMRDTQHGWREWVAGG
jgi:hypothetical protein